MKKNQLDTALGASDKADWAQPAQTGRVVYTAKTHTTGGRENGVASSSDDRLNIRLATPGSTKPGTNPEQLFAAGWSACFEGAMGMVAKRMRIELPEAVAIDAEVDLCLSAAGAYFLRARLNISLPDMEHDAAEVLINAAHQTCPYSKAIHGNVEVELNLI